MPEEELTLILRLRDEATAAMGNVRNQIAAAGAAIGAAGFKPQAPSGTARRKPSSRARARLEKSLKPGCRPTTRPWPATALERRRRWQTSTRTSGLRAKSYRRVAEMALKAKVDTNAFGGVAKQLGLDAEGSLLRYSTT